MKHVFLEIIGRSFNPAAFGRLCVETVGIVNSGMPCVPAAFGRLCVETGRRHSVVA